MPQAVAFSANHARRPRRRILSGACRAWRVTGLVSAFFVSACCVLRAEDVSAPVILQYFESTYGVIEQRAPDVFKAGYGAIYTPPPGRADSGNVSVGYAQYDRFDL